jgi:hypothetical protein
MNKIEENKKLLIKQAAHDYAIENISEKDFIELIDYLVEPLLEEREKKVKQEIINYIEENAGLIDLSKLYDYLTQKEE